MSSEYESPKCVKCNDTGFTPRNETGRVSVCECRPERVIASMIPLKFQTARLSDFKKETQAKIATWIASPGGGLRMVGKVGCGKTHLACAIFRAWITSGKQGKFIRLADLYLKIRETYNSSYEGPSEDKIIADYCDTPLLVVDDLGAGSTSDHERRITLELFDRRINNVLPTVVTTNWTLEDIGRLMDERISSRLETLEPLVFPDVDRRKKAK